MKQIEDLIELLNEHRKEMNGDGKWYTDTDNYNMLTLNNLDKLSSELWVISKDYGFIKRLVDNDKIDLDIIPNKIKEIGIPMLLEGKIEYGFDSSDYYWVLMLLSIQDEPIEFLISYLK